LLRSVIGAASSVSFEIPPVTPIFISIQALPGRSPWSCPSGSTFVCDRRSSSTPVTEAAIGSGIPLELVTPVKESRMEPERLSMRGRLLFATLPSKILPSSFGQHQGVARVNRLDETGLKAIARATLGSADSAEKNDSSLGSCGDGYRVPRGRRWASGAVGDSSCFSRQLPQSWPSGPRLCSSSLFRPSWERLPVAPRGSNPAPVTLRDAGPTSLFSVWLAPQLPRR
jgi:hypothetical protein